MDLNWGELFGLSVPPLELFVRASAMYFFLLALFRVVVKRRVGAIAIADLLVLVIIADASQNAMAGEYRSITDGFIVVGTIIGWNYFFDWLAYRSPAMRKLLEPAPLLIIDDGRVVPRHLRAEFITADELKSQLRQQGVNDPAEVAKAYLEPGGQISVIKKKK